MNLGKRCLSLTQYPNIYGSIEVGVEGRKVIVGLLASLALTQMKDSMAAEARKSNVGRPYCKDSKREARKTMINTVKRH